ncbi:MAG: 4a-hydroxytetrahydrobiopterin dehydratase [Solirubrobacteraceae bacterium]|nr:4a-hydroxytetrahydrobiopterin dehydratase [Solirubrobacteraceae bacterium]
MPSTLAERRLSGHPGWRRSGQALIRELAFRDFEEAMTFVERVATAAEDHLRRPDMCILDFNRVRLTVANPRHAGITPAELRLVAKVNALVDG